MNPGSIRSRIAAILLTLGHRLAQITGAISATLLFAMFGVVILGVVFRYVIQSPLQWTEELSRFLMLWTGFMALNVAMFHRQHLAIDTLVAQLPERVSRILGYICDILIAYFLVVLIDKGYSMTTRTMMQASSMNFSMFWIYMAVPLGALLTLIQHLLQIGCKLIEPSVRSPATGE